MACLSLQQGVKILDVRFMRVGCSLIGSGEDMKWSNQIGELGHSMIGFLKD